MPSVQCPTCSAGIAGIDGETGGAPGQPIVCVCCRAIAVFTDDGSSLRRPSDAELDKLLVRPDVIHAIQVVAHFHRQHGAPKAR